MGTSDTSEWNFNLLILIVVMKLSGYIKELLEDLNEDREVSTPYGNDLFEIEANSDLLSSEEKEKFHSTVDICILQNVFVPTF
jgi:hypothetical protein